MYISGFDETRTAMRELANKEKMNNVHIPNIGNFEYLLQISKFLLLFLVNIVIILNTLKTSV